MEILQKIWIVLTTENEKLTNIIVSPLAFIEIFLYMLIFTTVLKLNASKKQKLIYVLSFSIFSILSLSFMPSPYYTFLNIIAWPILVLLIFKTSPLKAILSEIIVYIFSIIINLLLISISVYVMNIPSSIIESTPLYRIIFSVLTYLLFFLIYLLFKKINFRISLLDRFKKYNKYFVINLILGSIAIAIQSYIQFTYIDYIPLALAICSLIILFTYFIISLYSLLRTNKLEITSEKLEEEQLYNRTLNLLYDNIRGFKHDFNNIVQGIGGYIATNNMDGLKEYYSEVLDDCQRVNNLSLLNPEIINNSAIYSLLAYKYHTATEDGIKVNLNVFMDLTTINMQIYELTRILGILIDNAIEAAKITEEKTINITIRKNNKKNQQLFIIENTYQNKDVNIDEIFEKGKTSKSNEDAKNHGLGLWEVRNIVKKRKNLNLYTTKDNIYFKQQLEINC